MAEEKQKPETKTEEKKEELNTNSTETAKNQEKQKEDKSKDKKQEIKKEYAEANGFDLHLSPKHCQDICNMIRAKDVDKAINMLEEVLLFKIPVRMNTRQVGHRHGKGIMAGRYPMNASKEFIRLLKQLKANAIHLGLEIEECVIECHSDRASKPFKPGGRRFKRAHVNLKLVKNKNKKNQEKQKAKPEDKKEKIENKEKK